ncbi:FAD-dependent oxidoreductase, partial [Spirochaetota bacterium]
MKLLEPGKIGNLEIKNRIVMAAMGVRGLCDEDGDWGERFRSYYEARAAGGVGLITTEMTFATQDLEPVAKLLYNLKSDKHLDSMRKLTKTLHSYDCKLSVQLSAGFGRVIPAPIIDEEVPPVSASENTNYYVPDYPEYNSHAMTTEQTAALAQSFGYAAKRCREGGADCIEFHGHEGYLLDQFMSAIWNRREDRYGGSREKRLTLMREAIEAIQREAGKDFPIIYRYGIAHHLEGGREEEEGLWLAGEFEKMGVSALHVDAGCYETSWWPHPPAYQPPGCMVDVADKIKKVTKLPVIAVGKLNYPKLAEEVVAKGKADFIAIGRGLLADPNWVNKVQKGKADEIIPCIACHEGCLWQMIGGEPTSCTVNPLTGYETVKPLTKLKEKRSLLIVGGGPGGIEAARVGSERGFDVTLWEASDKLGGALWTASAPYFKGDITEYLNYLTGLTKRISVKVELNKEATKEDILAFGADYVIIATGGKMEPCPFEGSSIISAIDVLEGTEPKGNKILMMGGGVTASETALQLTQKGKEVILCARADDDDLDMSDFYDHHNRHMLLKLLNDDPKITIYKGTIPVKIESDHVVAEQNGAEIKIPMDSLVFAGRQFPINELTKELEGERIYGTLALNLHFQ